MELNIIKRVKKKEKMANKEKMKNKVPDAPSNDTSTLLNIDNLKNLLGSSEDIKYREILINNNTAMPVNLIYIDGLVNSSDISNYVVKPLIQNEKINGSQNLDETIKLIQDGVLYFASQVMTNDLQKVIDEITSGSSVLLFSDKNIAFIFDTKGFEKRSIIEPTVENVTKGPKDSFVENYRTNTATIRRKIKTQDLVIESVIIGKQSHTNVGIVYIKSITNEELIQQVRNRLGLINTDKAFSTSIIEDALSDDINSSFPQVLSTERPDKFSSDITEGRVGIIVDGIPFGFIVPGTLVQFMQATEDYSHKAIVSSLIRIIRIVAVLISLTLPGLYISIVTFNPEMIPTQLASFLAKSREGVAVPIAIETIAMLLAFEILYEAGLRVPKTIGQAVSIVGTLVVGQAAVEAKLVSPAIVVIVAMTAISSFTVPNQDFSNVIRIWRFILAAVSTVLGLLGLMLTIIVFTFKLCKIESFGVSYLSPFVSNDGNGIIEDTIIKIQSKFNKLRPTSLNVKNKKKQGD